MSELFKRLESASPGTRRSADELLDAIAWNVDGLIPAIAQQHDSGEVLMMAWMNRESLQETLTTGRVCYWSRSRGKLWRKGESSGQEQHLRSAHLDCDGDTLLLGVDQTGPACHTGRRSCFYVALDATSGEVDSAPLVDPAELYRRT
ncbi:phosphoribosyl-AMP cyclohydrolase [Litchfieldella qijiaojingensis]|uniref:Phosphoribosyl-AMP cyclohydrolase n=1 Tax=Litchfieldella qijiaojingensis TaxID=980347 RepID=A0ABQ2YCP3_9GAMM|nr:phosphoribosyl-AMP cyclohydrolase [Halomonas qijiaojingensis]GGX78974.1 phosphoribosyl-AMP cyclohydrolase [Halomonas qijiaojingensis]